MNKLIEEAMEVLRHLPEDVQQAAARSIIGYGTSQDDDLQSSDR